MIESLTTFRVGDLVRGKQDNGYWITTEDALMKVIGVYSDGTMKVEVLKQDSHPWSVGNMYDVDAKDFIRASKYRARRFKNAVIKDGEGRMVKEDWVVVNWEFLSGRRVTEIPFERLKRILTDGSAPSTGKFYGVEDLYNRYSDSGSITHSGTRRLFLRPFISAPMPMENIKGVYIDPKKYRFDEDGKITGLDTLYEIPIFVFKEADRW